MTVSNKPQPELSDVLTELRSLKEQVERLDYKFDTYEKASDKVVRLATTIIIAAATVAVLPSALQAVSTLVTQVIAAGQ
jgi:hypothetical protein